MIGEKNREKKVSFQYNQNENLFRNDTQKKDDRGGVFEVEDDRGEYSMLIDDKRPSQTSTLKSLLNGRRSRNALSNHYMEIRCGRFDEDNLYLDLTGKIVERHLGRRLDDEDMSSICSYLIAHKKIVYLSLGYNHITEQGFSHLAHYLTEEGCTLLTLNLTQNDICSIDDSVLRNTAALWKLRCLILRGNKLGPKGGLILARMVKQNVSLVHLDVAETDQTVQSLFHIIQSLVPYLDGNTTIRKLDISRLVTTSRQGFPIGSHLCNLMERFLLHNNIIVELHLERNEIADWDLELLIGGLRENKSLELINLTGNCLTSHGLELLSTVLPETGIRHLILSSNSISDDGAIALGKIFPATKIRFLDISYNKIRDIGMINLFIGMEAQIPPVHTLFIFGNPITKESMKMLLERKSTGRALPCALDINFTFDTNFAEDRSIKVYRNLKYFPHELTAYKKPLHHTSCY